MHTYPAGRVWLVAIVRLLALLLALPNVFGEGPALQLSRDDRSAVTQENEADVIGILDAAGIPVEDSYIEEDRLVLRFEEAAQQQAARDTIREQTGRDYLVALSQDSRMPGWMRAIGLKPMSLGLDLRGGVYFLYEVDVVGAVTQLLASMERDYRTLLREERIPFTTVENDGADTVSITLRNVDDLDRAEAAMRKQDSLVNLETSRVGGTGRIEVQLSPEQVKERQDFAIQQNITTLRNRVNELGVSEPIVARQGVDRIVVQLPGVQDPNEALRVLGETRLYFDLGFPSLPAYADSFFQLRRSETHEHVRVVTQVGPVGVFLLRALFSRLPCIQVFHSLTPSSSTGAAPSQR